MKLRLSEIIAAHDALKGSTIHTLELAEQSQIFKLNRALNAVVKPATEAREDIIDKLRPSNQEELRDLQSRIVSKKATAEEKAEFIVISNAHQAVIEEHLRPLLRKKLPFLCSLPLFCNS